MLKAGCKIQGALSKYNTGTPSSEHALELQSLPKAAMQLTPCSWLQRNKN